MFRQILTALVITLLGMFPAFGAQRATKSNRDLTEPIIRQKLLMDYGWKFHFGNSCDPKKDFGYGAGEIYAKEGIGPWATMDRFNDSSWQSINLPHDWGVYLPFVHVKNFAVMGHGYKPIGGEFPETSIGWYRKTFAVPARDSVNRTVIRFDGVFRDCIVWLNGNFVGKNMSGYAPFYFDVTNFINFGGKNVLAVRVNATNYEGWFYEGAGIYRHVWLFETPPLHIPIYGTYVRTTSLRGNGATLAVETKVSNHQGSPRGCEVESFILGNHGEIVAKNNSRELRLNPYEVTKFDQTIMVDHPKLWSPNSPHLYKLVSVVKSGGKVVDRVKTTFGIRTLRWTANDGFFLNGKRVELKGTCNHQDFAGVGTAVPDGLEYFRVMKLKEMGANAWRTSHDPVNSSLLDACDKLGMMVMDENRLLNSSPEYISQFEREIRRDRNHPSVIIWSIGNEEWGVQDTPIGVRIAKTLIRIQKELDPSRTCTMAANDGDAYAHAVNSVIPVRGFNYHLEDIDKYHRQHPDQPLVGTETASTVSTRGVYATDTTDGYVTDYDTNNPPWGETAEQWWSFYDARKFLSGGFVWTGFDYRGEPTPYRWPDINSNFGIMDVCGFPKNNFYYYQSWWSNKSVLHIFPHWNWPDSVGRPIDVWCFSNCDSVELFLNGKSLGTRIMKKDSHVQWSVNYEPGTLEAHGWRDGKMLVTKEETTGKPVSIKLTPDRDTILANGEGAAVVAVSVLDSHGREVPTADNLIHFAAEGEGQIIGVGNGNPSSHEADKYPDGNYKRMLFNGKCAVIILSDRKPGDITLKATGNGLKAATLTIVANPSKLIPLVEN